MSEPDATEAVFEPIDLGGATGIGPGGRVRDWTLGDRIGRGGSSVVFHATRTDADFCQRAALKLLRPVLSDVGFVARFERERRILLDLRHPNIVRILDGGQTPEGYPWYAMEAIDGAPLTEWATGEPLRTRLDALVALCRAVDHAHRRLIVHCDLKPSNVLVDASGAPHVLDFGIAKLVDEPDRTATVRMATPRWAAPEQLTGDPVTTATDVYALGLLLWSVLTERQPRADITGSALLAAASDPLPLPSSFAPGCAGDLDAIAARATAVEPGERYRSAADLADDIERHLKGEAVLAREGMTLYRISRWARRNRAVVVGLAAAVCLLVGWAVTGSIQATQVRAERDRARLQAERAEETLDLLVDMLNAADPAQAGGVELTVREVLQSGVRELDVPGRDPALVGEVRLVAGQVQSLIGAQREARSSLELAVSQLREAFGPDHPSTLRAELALSRVAFIQGEEEAALATAESLLARIEEHSPRPVLAEALLNVADMQAHLRRHERARELARRAREIWLDEGDQRHAARALALQASSEAPLGIDGAADRMDQALAEATAALGTRLHREVADILHERTMIPGHPDPGRFEQSLALRRELYGEGWMLATALNNYGLALEKTDPRASVSLVREACSMADEAIGADHPEAVRLRINLGALLVDTGHADEGIAILEDILARRKLSDIERDRAHRHLERARAG